MTVRPNVAVLGAGSVGCFIGAAWAASGCKVSLIGRPQIRADIAANGIRISDSSGWKASILAEAVDFSINPNKLKSADVILLCVKSNDTSLAAKQIAAHAGKGATVISFQNGISNVDRLTELLRNQQVLRGLVPFNVAYLGDGRWLKGTPGDLVVQDTPLTRELGEAIGAGPARLTFASNMLGLAWGKLLLNLNNAVNALSGETLLAELQQREYRRVVAAAIVEALEILDAAGIEPAQVGPIPPKLLPHAIAAPDFIFRNIFLRIQKIDPAARSSMADDFRAGRSTEVDFLNGEVVKLARTLGREAPVNSAIVSLVKQAEAGVEREWSPHELREHVFRDHREVAMFGY